MEHVVYLALGGNIGDPAANLRQGLQLLARDVEVVAVSALYETKPVGVVDQPNFLNAACMGRTKLAPLDLLERAKTIERESGRRPGLRWGPRPLDIDILLYDDAIVDTPALRIPHERLAERAFVLRPLADLNASLSIPGVGATVAQLLERVGTAGVERIAEPGWQRSGREQL